MDAKESIAHFFPLFLFPSTLTRQDEAENLEPSGLMKKEDKVKPRLMLSVVSIQWIDSLFG